MRHHRDKDCWCEPRYEKSCGCTRTVGKCSVCNGTGWIKCSQDDAEVVIHKDQCSVATILKTTKNGKT